jgi:hypothetical protein
MTPSAYGNLSWGGRGGGAKAVIGARSAEELSQLGLTVAKAQRWQDFYLNAFIENPNNLARSGSRELMQNVIEALSRSR